MRMGEARSIEHTFGTPIELAEGIHRITWPLGSGPKHVHCYVVRGDDGWMLVDTGLRGQDWSVLPTEVDRVFITHMHPDHVGGAADAAQVTGAPLLQGTLDHAQYKHIWGTEDWPKRISLWFTQQGVPADLAVDLLRHGHLFVSFVKFAEDPELVDEGDVIDGWEVFETPGHADGHLCLLRNGVLVAGDHILNGITPAIGLFPDSRPDPLGDYLTSLHKVIDLDPQIAYPGHGDPIEQPAERAQEIIEHHRLRLEQTAVLLEGRPRSGFEISQDLFGKELGSSQRRFAVAETLSHLERLVVEGDARRVGDERLVLYTSA
jgi:glyoxylase-like metal-dependent hydrolase (beta-lactamase superfamily II)